MYSYVCIAYQSCIRGGCKSENVAWGLHARIMPQIKISIFTLIKNSAQKTKINFREIPF
jgi:hypothetical protein